MYRWSLLDWNKQLLQKLLQNGRQTSSQDGVKHNVLNTIIQKCACYKYTVVLPNVKNTRKGEKNTRKERKKKPRKKDTVFFLAALKSSL